MNDEVHEEVPSQIVVVPNVRAVEWTTFDRAEPVKYEQIPEYDVAIGYYELYSGDRVAGDAL